MAKRLTIKTLRDAGHQQREVATLTGASERTVRRIDDEPMPASLDDRLAHAERHVGRPSKVSAVRDKVLEMLRAEPTLASTEVYRRLKRDGYAGQKSALFAAVAELRPPAPPAPLVRFEGLPGEFSQHDFGQVDVTFFDGRKERIHFFASRLKYSRTAAVSLVPDETVESVVRPLVAHFEAFGGVPLVAVFDRPKTIALKWDPATARVTEWNPTFLQVMAELGVAPDACWPHRPNQKGAVENQVGWVKGSFFKCRRFADREDLERQLAQWLVEVNTQRPSRATGEIPETLMASAERARLRPLKVTSATLVLRFPTYVAATASVSFKGAVYSMPPQAIGLPATVHLGQAHVRIVAGRWDVRHPRCAADQRSILPEHRTAMVAAVNGQRGKLYLKRQQLMDLGPSVVDFLTEVVHRRPGRWSQDVEILAALHDLHGSGRLLSALGRAMAQRLFSGNAVAAELGHDEFHIQSETQELQ